MDYRDSVFMSVAEKLSFSKAAIDFLELLKKYFNQSA
jgi:hypothetical protein